MGGYSQESEGKVCPRFGSRTLSSFRLLFSPIPTVSLLLAGRVESVRRMILMMVTHFVSKSFLSLALSIRRGFLALVQDSGTAAVVLMLHFIAHEM